MKAVSQAALIILIFIGLTGCDEKKSAAVQSEVQETEKQFGVKLSEGKLLTTGTDFRNNAIYKKTNTAAWQSAAHGKWFVDVFVSRGILAEYDALKPIPEGGAVIKQGYKIASDAASGVATGPLFVMKKMPKGYDPAFGDWSFALGFPSASQPAKYFLFGEGKDDKVTYCKNCHSDGGGTVGTFGAPKELRAK
ncbi:MAG: hypothetical protein IAF08_08970 [Rhizobacter sp.]|nr:hypothetical protein [Chlorobiales bacterium]